MEGGQGTQPGILVGLPAYGGHIYHECFVSLMLLERACRARGILIDYEVIANESLIPRARNILVRKFLDSGRSHLLFIDADIGFRAEDVLRMYDAGLPLIGGIYPKKNLIGPGSSLHSDFAVTPLPGMVGMPMPEGEAPFPVAHIGTGLMMVRRDVFETLESVTPFYRSQGVVYRAYFDTSITEDGVYLSEDYHFCERWRGMGGMVYAAPWFRCTHWGTYGFSGVADKI